MPVLAIFFLCTTHDVAARLTCNLYQLSNSFKRSLLCTQQEVRLA